MRIVPATVFGFLLSFSVAFAEPPQAESLLNSERLDQLIGSQTPQKLLILVKDSKGNPVENAAVTPWALRSSQGHGWWADDGEDRSGMEPKTTYTNADGTTAVWYPEFRDEAERTRTISVTLLVDHPDHAFRQDIHIDVPHDSTSPYEVSLEHGTPLFVRPMINGKPVSTETIHASSSDGRSWHDGYDIRKTQDGRLRFPSFGPGDASVLLVQFDDNDQATHFSKLHDFDVPANERLELELELTPAVRVRGRLSDNVPRPIKNGRIKVETLPPKGADPNRVMWTTWAPIDKNGEFEIRAWPSNEPIQVIALCDGFIAQSGADPPEVERPTDPKKRGHFFYPQVFREFANQTIEVEMESMVPCHFRVVDSDGQPLEGIEIKSWPNVCWWNTGSQVYCHPLVRGERLVLTRDYFDSVDESYQQPFTGTTDREGNALIQLPVGGRRVAAESETHELPVFLGRRQISVTVSRKEPVQVTLQMQQKGTDLLGQWDKLAGVIFGCSTKEGKRICALPEVRAKMDRFAKEFREAKDKQDPKLLAEAFATVAEAFRNAGDPEEAAKWQAKAEKEQQRQALRDE